jgi:hypothetical protein
LDLGVQVGYVLVHPLRVEELLDQPASRVFLPFSAELDEVTGGQQVS